MSRRVTRSTQQYSPLEDLPAGPTDPALADNSFREAVTGAVAVSVAFPAAVLAASAPTVAVAVLAAVAAALVGRATVRRKDARGEREAARVRTADSSGTTTAQAAD